MVWEIFFINFKNILLILLLKFWLNGGLNQICSDFYSCWFSLVLEQVYMTSMFYTHFLIMIFRIRALLYLTHLSYKISQITFCLAFSEDIVKGYVISLSEWKYLPVPRLNITSKSHDIDHFVQEPHFLYSFSSILIWWTCFCFCWLQTYNPHKLHMHPHNSLLPICAVFYNYMID